MTPTPPGRSDGSADSRSPGSNSLAVAGHRSDTGGALMANDPHLGILVPNVWLIAGVRSPSYHAVGLMAPGLPIFAIGRNPHIAWGGTNMRAASSDLYDVSKVPASEIDERSESIGVRWWFDSDVTVRETRWGADRQRRAAPRRHGPAAAGAEMDRPRCERRDRAPCWP